MKDIFSFALSLIVAGTLFWGSVGPVAAQEAELQSSGINPPLASGRYPDTIAIPVERSGWEYRFLTTSGTPHTDFFMPLDAPLLLGAPPNATATYRLAFRYKGTTLSPVSYTIDRSSPTQPFPSIHPGTYNEPIVLESAAVPSDETVYVLLQPSGAIVEDAEERYLFEPMGGAGIEIAGAPGRLVDYEVLMYSEDGVGNRSAVSRWPFRIDRRGEVPPPERIVVSPVAGSFANQQLLVIDDRALDDVEVVLNGPNGSERFTYTGERLVSGSGDFEMIVSATRRDDGSRVERAVSWTQQDETLRTPQSGRHYQTITVFPQFEDGTPLYNLEDLPVSSNDDALIQPLRLRPGADSKTTVVVRMRRFNDPRSSEWRYTYIIDGRSAAPAEAVRYKDSIVLYALGDTTTEYRTIDADGAASNFQSYQGPILLESLPETTIALGVRTRYDRGIWGVEERYPVRPPEDGSVPTGALNVEQSGGTIEMTRTLVEGGDQTGMIQLYDDSESAEPFFEGALHRRLVWAIPRGLQLEFFPRFFIGTSAIDRVAVDDSAFVTTESEPRVIDTAPPAPPIVSVRSNTVTLESENLIMARVDSNPFEAVPAGRIRLEGESGRIVERRVEAYSVADGEVSPRIVSYVTIDDRQITFPPLYSGSSLLPLHDPERTGSTMTVGGFSVPTGTFVTNARELRFSIFPTHNDVEVYYRIGYGSPPEEPTETSERTTDEFSVSIPEDRATEIVYIRGKARFEGSDDWSDEALFIVVVDTEPPAAPVVEDPDSMFVETNQRVTVSFGEPAEEGVSLWFRTRPDRPFRPYDEVLSVAPDSDRPTVVEAYSEDVAGNRTYLETPITIRSARDEERRIRFTLNGLPTTETQVLISRDTLLGARHDAIVDGDGIEWRVYENDATERPAFEPYSEEVLLTVPESESEATTYIAETRIVGRNGSVGSIARLQIVADISASQVPSPEIIRGPQGLTGTLLFPGTNDVTIFLAGTGDADGFREIRDTVQWRIPDATESITLRYFAIDGNGRRSETNEVTIRRPRSIEPPIVTGVDDGGVYRSTQTIEIAADEGVVRYSVTTDGSDPPPIHRLSAPVEGPIQFAPPLGVDRTYSLRYASFLPNGSKSAEGSLRFRIDRRSPSAPRLLGARDEQFFPEATRVRLDLNDEDGDLFFRMYRIEANGRNEGVPLPTFQSYQREEILLAGLPGEISSYRIEAYSVDAAGNRSQSISTWTVHVDQAVVYVAVDSDDPDRSAGDGTRTHPYTDIDTALDMLLQSERKTLFLAGGEYIVDSTVFNRATAGIDDMAIVGGFDRETWEVGEAATTIATTAIAELHLFGTQRLQRIAFAPTIDAVVIDGSSVTLSNFSGGRRTGLYVQSGRVALRDVAVGSVTIPEAFSNVNLEPPQIEGVNLELHRLSLVRGRASIDNGRIGAIEVSESAFAEITDSRIGSVGDRARYAERSVIDEIIRVDGGVVELRDSGVYGRNRRTIKPMITAVNAGNVALYRSIVQGAAEDDIPLLLIRGVESDIVVEDTVLVGVDGVYTYGVVARGSSVRIENSVISLDGGSEQTAIIVADSTLDLRGSATVNRVGADTVVRALQSSGRSASHRIEDTLMVLVGESQRGESRNFGTTSALDRANIRDTRTYALSLGDREIVDLRSVGIVGWTTLIDDRGSAVWPGGASRQGDAEGYAEFVSTIRGEFVHPVLLGIPQWPSTVTDAAAIIDALKRSVPSQVLR